MSNNLYSSLRLKLAILKAKYYDWKLGIDVRADNEQGYYSSFYGRIEKMVRYLKLSPEDVFVDLGCGKGRVIFFVATHKLKKVIGVELDRNLFDIAQSNLRKLKIKISPVELINADAAELEVEDGTVFYMFNPFGYRTIEKVIDNIRESLISNPREIRIVYYVPICKDFLDNQEWLIREGQIENEHCLIWRSK